jgi:hypothetical protein
LFSAELREGAWPWLEAAHAVVNILRRELPVDFAVFFF